MKIKRDAFLFMKGGLTDFAQCGCPCRDFDADAGRCNILGPKFEVTAEDSCGVFINGKFDPEGRRRALATPEEVGFVSRKVRCENCRYGGEPKCRLYVMLNRKLPDVFDLDEAIEPKDCCNAQVPG